MGMQVFALGHSESELHNWTPAQEPEATQIVFLADDAQFWQGFPASSIPPSWSVALGAQQSIPEGQSATGSWQSHSKYLGQSPQEAQLLSPQYVYVPCVPSKGMQQCWMRGSQKKSVGGGHSRVSVVPTGGGRKVRRGPKGQPPPPPEELPVPPEEDPEVDPPPDVPPPVVEPPEAEPKVILRMRFA
jgi:hypothetical protein